MQTQTLIGDWQFRECGKGDWLPARVPGSAYTDLLALERIPDPFYGDNEQRTRWVAEADWEYRISFSCSPELLSEDQVFLICDGLDTLATVSLNGQEIGRTDNMFRQYRWDVKPLLSSGSNELLIAFASVVKHAAEKQAERALPGVPQAIPGGPYLRKAPCQFGWDWGPQLPPTGIWKDIRLEGYSQARMEEVHIRQEHHDGRVRLTTQITLEGWSEMSLLALIRVTTPGGEALESRAEAAAGREIKAALEIERPELWWPNGYGDQPLYTVALELRTSAGGEERLLDRRDYQIGLRTIELRQEEDAWGRSFEFAVNGVPVFAKGANWIPADSFPTRLTDEHLEMLIRSAAETHQNMLRVWGGGFYEDERFYDLCDRYGILVWQEFIFSCSVYPLNDPEFVENLREEVAQNIRRLRHRASLALWCGNNEMEWGWVDWGWNRPALQDLKDAYDAFFHRTLPEWCKTEDPDRQYWPSSPSTRTPFENPNGQSQGDAHYWDVWHGRKPFTAYRGQYPRFMSEFGFQSLPPLDTIRTYAEEADWNMTSYIMEQHQKNASGNGLMIAQMTDNFRMPKDFPSLVYLSMVLQSEGIRYGVEHWRRHKDRVAGTLYWQLNDCWPVASWSSLDYFGRWKALHYAARRFYAPLMLSVEDQGAVMSLYLTSDLGQPWEGEIRWSLETLEGEALLSGREKASIQPYASSCVATVGLGGRILNGRQRDLIFVAEEKANIQPYSSDWVTTIDLGGRVPNGRQRELIFVAELWREDRRLSLQAVTFVPTKHLALTDPEIDVKTGFDGDRMTIELASRSLARLVEVSIPGADVIFSDNYFDLPAGRSINISCKLPEGWTAERAEAALKVRTVYDTYAHTSQ